MPLADQIEATFPPGTRLPADLRRLCAFAETAGRPVSCYHEIEPAGELLRAWLRGDEAAAGRFAPFGAGHNGSVLALWLHAGPDAAAAPVVVLGPHPLHHALLAADPRAFLHLLGVGYSDLGFDDLTAPPDQDWNPAPAPEKLRAWLAAEFGVSPPPTGSEIVREATARHPDLGAWVRDWRRRAYPEPPAERFRDDLRDLMAGALHFKLFPKSLPPTQNAALRRDLLRVAEHLSESYLEVRVPAAGEVRDLAAEVADDILGRVERGERHRLRPTVWAVRTLNGWWHRMGLVERFFHALLLRGGPTRYRTARPSRRPRPNPPAASAR